MSSRDLPSFHATQHSTCTRNRRKRTQTPAEWRDKFMRFVEYPAGVYVNRNGAIEPSTAGEHKKLFAASDDDNSDSSDSDSDVIEIPATGKMKKPKLETVIPPCTELCVVCLENRAVGVFLDCAHQCACIKCGSKLEQCPLCRTKTAFIHHLDVPLNVKTFK